MSVTDKIMKTNTETRKLGRSWRRRKKEIIIYKIHSFYNFWDKSYNKNGSSLNIPTKSN